MCEFDALEHFTVFSCRGEDEIARRCGSTRPYLKPPQWPRFGHAPDRWQAHLEARAFDLSGSYGYYFNLVA